jgi:hypothetical protein
MRTPQQTIDRLGGLLSLVCAIHCAAAPALVVVAALGLPLADALPALEDERIELGFSLAAVVFVTVSVGLHWRHADRLAMLARFGLGLALLLGPRLLLGPGLIPAPEWLAHVSIIAGALLLAWTHRRGYRGGYRGGYRAGSRASGATGGRESQACCVDAPTPAAFDPATSSPGLLP